MYLFTNFINWLIDRLYTCWSQYGMKDLASVAASMVATPSFRPSPVYLYITSTQMNYFYLVQMPCLLNADKLKVRAFFILALLK